VHNVAVMPTGNLGRSFALGATMFMLMFCVSASAGQPNTKKKNAIVPKQSRKMCFVHFGGSAFAEPCDRLAEMPATAEPMHIIGKLPVIERPVR
jgi:hypothetical protein